MNAATTRIYVVDEEPVGHRDGERLVRAVNATRARHHVTAHQFKVRVATQSDLERLLKAGIPVETAGAAVEEADAATA